MVQSDAKIKFTSFHHHHIKLLILHNGKTDPLSRRYASCKQLRGRLDMSYRGSTNRRRVFSRLMNINNHMIVKKIILVKQSSAPEGKMY